MKDHNVSRRRFIGTGMQAAAGLALTSKGALAKGLFKPAKVDSKINGVQIGVITYSFRSMPSDIDSLLKYCIECNINAVELMGDSAEAYAGTPKYVSGTTDFPKKMADWREGAAMDQFIAIRKMFNDQNINIYAWKPNALGAKNTDGEIAYAFKAGKALGCSHVTVELPTDSAQTQRLGDLAEKNDMMVGYHAHTQATATLWDTALGQSKHNGINLDVGHYVAGTSSSPIDFIQKNHKRILSMHLKDRKFNNGPNMPWGEGDTPIKDVLVLMKKEGYKFPATIEQEYKIPDASDAVKEVMKCRAFAAAALA
jgi:sugar phosphate isomerase/epimerase